MSNCKPSRKNIPLPTFSQAVALALVKGNIDGRTRHNVAGENASFYLTIYPEVLDSMWRREGLGKKDVTTTSPILNVDQESRFSCPEGLEQLPWVTSRHDWNVATASSHHAAFF